MTTVVNLFKEKYDVYIGRPSKWGNPFKIAENLDRKAVIQLYRLYLYMEIKEGRITKEDLLSLKGKRLGCFCKPKACHGDVLVRAIEYYWSDDD